MSIMKQRLVDDSGLAALLAFSLVDGETGPDQYSYGGEARMTGLAAAAIAVDITPPAGHPLGGYIARRLPSTGVHDPLTASLVRLTDGVTDVVWVAIDALGIDAVDCARLRDRVGSAAGVPADSVLICASHTHSGPSGWLRPIYRGFPSVVSPQLLDTLLDTIGDAAGSLIPRPVEVRWAVRPGVGVGRNRNDPAGPHEDSVGVLALDGVAIVADYACHPTVLGTDNLLYSADFPGAARARVGTLAFLQGAAGDASTRFTRREQSFAEADRLGGLLGAAITATTGAAITGPLSVRRSVVTLPVRIVPVGDPVASVPALDVSAAGAARLAESRREGAQLLAALRAADLPDTLELPISVVTLGEVAWVHLPVEPFASYGAAIAAGSPYADTRVIGYADGYFGYLADAAAHAAGTYEAQASMFDAAAGRLVVDAALALLDGR